MDRSQALEQLRSTLEALVIVRRTQEAAARGWPLPDGLSLHLWMYAQGLVGPTEP